MAAQNSELLNRLLVRVYRGLVQYAVECWPWTASAEAAEAGLNGAKPAEQSALEQIAARQQTFVGRLVDLLSQRNWVVDLGSYPDFSGLHYVSLDYLLGKLIASEQELIVEAESALPMLRDDPDAAGTISELIASERENLARLRELSKSAAPASA